MTSAEKHSSRGIQLIAGLGNPGPQYEATRHNVGFWLTDLLCQQSQATFTPENKFKGLTALIKIAGQDCRVIQPSTYMNRSGEAILAIANFYKILPHEILVVHDDLDLPVGNLRLKFDGGHGGHNGLRDIVARIGSKQFYRLRIGIGHPGDKDDVLNYVLHRPSISDKEKILTGIDHALAVMSDIVQGKIEKAMTLLHTATKG